MESTELRVVVTVVPTKADVTAALTAWSWLHLVRLRRALALVGLTFGLVAVLDLVVGGRAVTSAPVVGVGVVYVVVVLGSPWLLGRRTLEGLGVGAPVTWTFDAAGMSWVTAKNENQVTWGRVSHLRRTDRVVAFLLRPRHAALAVPASALDDAQLERIRGWWQAATPDAGPSPAASVPGGPPDDNDWGGPAWTDEVVVTAPMTLAVVRAMNRYLVPRRAVVVLAVSIGVWAVPPALRLVLAPGEFGFGDVRFLAGSVVVAAAALTLREVAYRRVAARLSGGPTQFRATPQGLSMQTPLGRTTVPWSRVQAARDARGVLVVRTDAPRCPIALPTAGLPVEDRARVAEWLRTGTGGRVALDA